jgi:hypothetical protein
MTARHSARPRTFTMDRTPPGMPLAESAVYLGSDQWEPRGGLGVPGDFTFTANGSADVVSYSYRLQRDGEPYEWKSVPASRLGGPATVTFTPTETGIHYLAVYAVDSAGNHSCEYTRSFRVRDIRPHVFSGNYSEHGPRPEGNIGVPGVFEFSQGMPAVVEYTYRLEDASAQTVAADADGKAKVTLAPTHSGYNVLYVRNTDRSGRSSTDREFRFYVDTAPVVTATPFAIGSESTVTVQSRFTGTVVYEYWFQEWGGGLTSKVAIPADADGNCEFKWTPAHHRVNAMYVMGRRADGTTSETRYVSAYVDDVEPTITLTGAARPGVPGTIRFASRLQRVVSYSYSIDPGVPAATVAAEPDGTATVEWTPAVSGRVIVSVEAHNVDGYVSNTGAEWALVAGKP